MHFDKNGIPVFDGDPQLMEEYSELCWDVFHSKAGHPDDQAVTAVRLRSGLTGAAYEAVRSLDHARLITYNSTGKAATPGGTQLLLDTLETIVNKERPIRAAEMFDSVFFNACVWRQTKEPMQQYIQRRDRDFEQLKKVSTSTQVLDDIKAHLLLKFSRISTAEQAAIISSCGNVYDLTKFKTALRMQHHAIHERDQNTGGKQPPSRTPATLDQVLGCRIRRGRRVHLQRR